MSGQWEHLVEQAAEAMHDLGNPKWKWADLYPNQREPHLERMRTLLATVGPLIAEDTRERMVAAAGAALKREPALRKRWAVRRVFARTWIEEFTGTEAEVDEYLASVYVGLPAEKHHLVHKASMLTSDWTVAP